MGEMVKTVFDSVGDVISGIAGGIKSAASELIYEDPNAAEPVLSNVLQFGLIFLGVSIATGIAYKVFSMIRKA